MHVSDTFPAWRSGTIQLLDAALTGVGPKSQESVPSSLGTPRRATFDGSGGAGPRDWWKMTSAPGGPGEQE
jgi:hypothetical protein